MKDSFSFIFRNFIKKEYGNERYEIYKDTFNN